LISLLKTTFKFKESLTLLNNEKLGIDDYENFKEYQKLEKAIKLVKRRKQIMFFQANQYFSNSSYILSLLLIAL
jgi:hypothetical protein